MLIYRDGLQAQPYGMSHNVQNLLLMATARGAGGSAPPSAGYTMNPLQQRENMIKEEVEKRRADLMARATGAATGAMGDEVKVITKGLLSI